MFYSGFPEGAQVQTYCRARMVDLSFGTLLNTHLRTRFFGHLRASTIRTLIVKC
jgi:hypothetical protein